MPGYARISINIAQISGLFDYVIAPQFEEQIQPGSLVNVPFGKQMVQGIVVELIPEPSVTETKPIQDLVEDEPVITAYQMQLAQWMAEQNLSTLAVNLDIMLPPGLSQHADIFVHLITTDSSEKLTPLQIRILNTLSKRGDLRGRQLDASLPQTNWRESLPGLIKRNLVSTRPILPPPSIRPKTIRTASYSVSEDISNLDLGREGSTAHKRRRAVLEFLNSESIPVNVSWVYAETGANSGDLTYLAERGLIILGENEIWRDPLDHLKPVLTSAPYLTPEQQSVWKHLLPQLGNSAGQKANLLVGVTGSGKTEIYLRATEEILKTGRQVIILVPEISLTPQTVKRFFARFPGKVGLIHSKLSPGERYDTWRRIRAGLLQVIIGPRSALFAPLVNPGLIVVDECHDDSFHQEDFQPHYHTLETAIQYGHLTGATLIFGSATPDVETVHQFKKRSWSILEMPTRILAHRPAEQNSDTSKSSSQTLPLPDVKIVDMRQELASGNRSALSRVLQEEIGQILSRQEQAILFLNRRGSASYVFCRDCGTVLRCPRCDTQLTYHANAVQLVCHTCNYKRKMPSKCAVCGSLNIRQFGMGTESLEKMVIEKFPSARVLRWDADTTRFKGAHDLILDHFTQHRADILIGTQMLAKGLDLPLVTLVGVILADVSLNLPDFRGGEKTFQILTQVAGRAGRSALGGKVVFQTFQPEHYAISSAASYDSSGFYQKELSYREKTGYPPFSRLLKIEIRHTDARLVEQIANEVSDHFAHWIAEDRLKNTSLIGPVPCFYSRRSGIYRWQIILRGPDPRAILLAHPITTWQARGITIDIVVDPVNLL